jgi:hypothetical protein
MRKTPLWQERGLPVEFRPGSLVITYPAAIAAQR